MSLSEFCTLPLICPLFSQPQARPQLWTILNWAFGSLNWLFTTTRDAEAIPLAEVPCFLTFYLSQSILPPSGPSESHPANESKPQLTSPYFLILHTHSLSPRNNLIFQTKTSGHAVKTWILVMWIALISVLGIFHNLKQNNFLKLKMYLHVVWWDNTGNWGCLGKFRRCDQSHRPLTTALFSNERLYFPKKFDIIVQKDLKILPGIRIKRQWQQLWGKGQNAVISRLFQQLRELTEPPWKVISFGCNKDLSPWWGRSHGAAAQVNPELLLS